MTSKSSVSFEVRLYTAIVKCSMSWPTSVLWRKLEHFNETSQK